MKFCYLGKSNLLILFALSTNTFNLLHQGFLLGEEGKGVSRLFYFCFLLSK